MELAMEPWARELLRCPACHGKLTDREQTPAGLDCETCAVVYPVKDGIPVLLRTDAQPR
ncbi:MAG TPA: Trm112 family protein [Actinomycetales bacterium]|nr:Trm112 family protein [Actinomycetales bacterium]